MKTLKSLISTCLAIVALSSVACALPPGKDGTLLPTLARKSQFEELKGGDKVVLVCSVCHTVKAFEIKDAKQAMALCKGGRTFYCPVCKKKYKVTWTPPGKSGGPQLTIVNEKGVPCMFLAKLS